MKTNLKATSIFHFLRGAIRGAYGVEDLRSLHFLFIGASEISTTLLSFLCIDGVDLKFYDDKMVSYNKYMSICGRVRFHKGEHVDVVVDFNKDLLIVKDKTFSISKIEDHNSYVQGIHYFYL